MARCRIRLASGSPTNSSLTGSMLAMWHAVMERCVASAFEMGSVRVLTQFRKARTWPSAG